MKLITVMEGMVLIILIYSERFMVAVVSFPEEVVEVH